MLYLTNDGASKSFFKKQVGFCCMQQLQELSLNSGTPSQEVRISLIIRHIVYMSVCLYGNT